MSNPQTAEGHPLVDRGNPYVQPVPARLDTGVVQTNQGPLLLLTVRAGSATVTVFLSKEDAKTWASVIENESNKVSSLLVAPAGAMPTEPLAAPAGASGPGGGS